MVQRAAAGVRNSCWRSSAIRHSGSSAPYMVRLARHVVAHCSIGSPLTGKSQSAMTRCDDVFQGVDGSDNIAPCLTAY